MTGGGVTAAWDSGAACEGDLPFPDSEPVEDGFLLSEDFEEPEVPFFPLPCDDFFLPPFEPCFFLGEDELFVEEDAAG